MFGGWFLFLWVFQDFDFLYLTEFGEVGFFGVCFEGGFVLKCVEMCLKDGDWVLKGWFL